MANWSLPSLASTYTNFLSETTARDVSCALWFNSATVSDTNIPTGTVRWNSSQNNWQLWSGSTWGALTATYGIDISGYSTHLVGGNNSTLLGSIPYQSNTNTTTLLSPNTTTTKKFFSQTGNGTNGAAPSWSVLVDGDIPSALTGKTYNGNTWTAGSGTLTIGASKTLTISNTVTLAGTDGSTITFGTGGTVLYSGGALGTPSSGVATNLTGTAAGLNIGGSAASATNATNATNIGVVDAAADTTCWVLLARTQTGTQSATTDAGIAYNASTDTLTVANVSGTSSSATALTQGTRGYSLQAEVTLSSTSTVITTSVPSWATKLYLMFNGLTLTNTLDVANIQVGNGASYDTTGYNGTTYDIRGASSFFHSTCSGISAVCRRVEPYSGTIIISLQKASTNNWAYSGSLGATTTAANSMVVSGSKGLALALTNIRVILTSQTGGAASGTMSGTCSIAWE